MTDSLVLAEPLIDVTPSPIIIKNEKAVAQAVDELVAKYGRDFVVTADNVADTKKMRAELNKVAKSINDRRLEVKRAYEKPAAAFDETMNGYKKKIQAILVPLDDKIEAVESEERQVRRMAVDSVILEMAGNYNISATDIEIRPSWLNKSAITKSGKVTKKVIDEIAADMTQLKKDHDQRAADVQTIKLYADNKGIEPSGWIVQLGRGATVTEILVGIDHAAEQAAQKAHEEAERKRKADETAKAVAATHQTMHNGELVDTETGEAVLLSTTLKLTGTHAQLLALRHWIDENGIKYERVAN
ncbi:DUF1351 domain-containing protein [Levilactobacillus namurensis]|uniref:DUF1351 domain-containing protein n=1 Tax=Levilactobacillus namurensis TaxID=380393 RepID=UPI00222F771B|nr:DUF1351 domain-containing protein [Levilactobacillus namurensis]MCW3778489.1 DUF1351 domain-containing protein [Levilactobacillus namurensis]MDT7019590.1 DUF1351 domain-containing protein [Levilactobacillus namurensis]WNN65823.1 DUF1351 domain-containing protein [Levilactobacillus namurensis]